MAKKKVARAIRKSQKTFDWADLMFGFMVFGRGVMSDDPKVQKTCGDILNDLAGKSHRSQVEKRSQKRRPRRKKI